MTSLPLAKFGEPGLGVRRDRPELLNLLASRFIEVTEAFETKEASVTGRDLTWG
jgi:hypothetical protein